MTAKSKLRALCEIEGVNEIEDMLGEAVMHSICPGICMNEWCSYTTEVEPDQERGYCELCHTQSVKSALVLAGII